LEAILTQHINMYRELLTEPLTSTARKFNAVTSVGFTGIRAAMTTVAVVGRPPITSARSSMAEEAMLQ
jgi:hypothetical protein